MQRFHIVSIVFLCQGLLSAVITAIDLLRPAMFAGFFFWFPVNRILVRKGIKPAM